MKIKVESVFKYLNFYKNRYNLTSQNDVLDLILYLISRFYLSKRELKIFSAFKLYVGSFTQAELSMLLQASQPVVHRDFASLRRKCGEISSFLIHVNWDTTGPKLRGIFSPRQFRLLQFMLTWNSTNKASKYFDVSGTQIYKECRDIHRMFNSSVAKDPEIACVHNFLCKNNLLKGGSNANG